MENGSRLPENSSEVARISPDGIMRFTVEANDENAAIFVECIEKWLKRRLTGIEVSQSDPSLTDSPSAIDLIVAERERQITQEGWSVSHDDQHEDSELAEAASCYALPPTIGVRAERWPWDWSWWKPTEKDRIRELVKAGALIIAEIERLQRLQA